MANPFEPIVKVSVAPGGWELRTTGRVLWVPTSTMEAWVRRAGISIPEVTAARCVLQLSASGEARGIGWPTVGPD